MSCEELSPAHKATEAKASSDASSPADSLITDQQLRRTPSSHSRAEGSFRARASHSPHVLLVESDPDQREPLEALLGKWGYRVDSADFGTRAIELAQTRRPSIALLDLRLPDMSGYQLAATLRASLGVDCRLIAVSASIEESEASNNLFDWMFQKPLDLRVLRELLHATLPPLV